MNGRILLFGISHRTCPLETRENYAISGEDLHHVLQAGRAIAGVEGVVTVSTCNRTEFYCLIDGSTDIEPMTFFDLVDDMRDIRLLKEDMIYCMADENAMRHLFRVTSGMDSMVLGEPQITGQVKQALTEARRAKSAGPVLGRIFEYAFSTAKEVRTRTQIGRGAVSVGYVAVELARKIFGDMKKTSLLLIGAGEIAEAAAKNLFAAGATNCVVTNRTFSRAMEVAEKFDWKARPFDELDDLLIQADIAVVAVGTGHYILDHERIRRIIKQRRHRYLFLVDMGVPRAVEPSVRDQENVFLYDIDDVEGIIHEHIEQRREFAQQAEKIIDDRITRGMAILSGSETKDLLAQLAVHLDDVRTSELQKALAALKHQPAEQVMDAMSKALVNKLFHPVFSLMKQENVPETPKALTKVLIEGDLPANTRKKQIKKENEVTNEDTNSHQNQ